MVQRASWLLPITGSDGQTREDTRLADQVMMSPDTAITAASGVRPGAASGATPLDLQGVSAMVAKVTAGTAVIQGTTAQGPYRVYNSADQNLTFADGNATNPRIDLVAFRVYDHFIDASGSTLAAIQVVQGTPSATPVAPALPSTSSLALWEVRVNAGVSAGNGGINSNPGWAAARTDRRVYTVAAGGIRPASGGWTAAYDGQYRDNGSQLQRWYSSNSSWNSPYAIGWLASRASDTPTASLSGGPWRINELGTITLAWSSTRRYLITAEGGARSTSGVPNGMFIDIRYKTGSSIPNDQNPSSSTLLANREIGFSANGLTTPVTMHKVYEPSVSETGTIALFWVHSGAGDSRINSDMVLIVEDIGPR